MMKYNKYLYYIPIILFALILIIKLLQLSKMIYLFPSYDFSGHLSFLYFLKEYGFHNFNPNWYNAYGGDIVLMLYPPGFSFYSLVFYQFIDNIQLAFYLSIAFLHVIGFIGILILGKVLKFSYIKRIFLFLFFYANPVSIPWFYFNGRLPEMLAWTLSFYLLAIIFYYKNKKLDKKFYILTPIIFSLMLLSHPLITLLFAIFFLGLFLIKSNKEKTKIILSCLFILILTSFWLIDFIKGYNIIAAYTPSYRIYEHPTEVFYSILFPLLFFIILFFNIKIKKVIMKKEILFYLPLMLIALLYITRLFLLIPVLRSIEPRSYGILLILISSLLILNLKINKKAPKLIYFVTFFILIIIPIISFVRYYEPLGFSLYTEDNKDILTILPTVKDSFIAIGKNSYAMHHLYSFAAVKYNLTTPFGWGMQEIQPEVKRDKKDLETSINNKDCKSFSMVIEKLNVKEIIAYKDKCDFLKTCNLNVKAKTENYCHLIVNNFGY